jgi:outer membrane protein assembly factor BamE (lipoprotein component of BamABCDE complex)
MFIKYSFLLILFLLPACMTAGEHRTAVKDDSGNRVTVGTVQKEIKSGMSAAKVAEVLGSPNIVTTDEERREVWIYDKFSNDVAVSENSGFGSLIILGSSGRAGASSSNQKTLTIIIKFDNDKKVRDFSYRTSRF